MYKCFYIIISSFVFIAIILLLMSQSSKKITKYQQENQSLKALLRYSKQDFEIKQKTIGQNFKEILTKEFGNNSDLSSRFNIVIIDGSATRYNDLNMIKDYFLQNYSSKHNILFCVSNEKEQYVRSIIKNNRIIIYSKPYYQLIRRLDLGLHYSVILLLDFNYNCKYSFLFYYDCFNQVIENSKIVNAVMDE